MDIAIVALLAVWALLSVAAQFRGTALYRAVKYRDHCAALPAWSFFAPNPGVTDFQLLYRNKTIDGSFTPWRAVCFDAPAWRRWFWHPEKRAKKFLHDWSSHLHEFAVAVKDERTYTHLGYIILLMYVTRQPHALDASQVQFLVARSEGHVWHAEPRITFVSGFHDLENELAEGPLTPEEALAS